MISEQSHEPGKQRLPRAKPAQIEWADFNDVSIFFNALMLAEVDLEINSPYSVHLTQGPVRVVDVTGEVGNIVLVLLRLIQKILKYLPKLNWINPRGMSFLMN